MNKIIDRKWALDYVDEDTKVIVASLVDGLWKVTISAQDVSNDWGNGDKISLESFTNYEEITTPTISSINLILNTNDYKTGNMAAILILNETKDEYKAVYVNFSDNGKIIVGSEKFKNSIKKHLNESDIEVRATVTKDDVLKIQLPKHIEPTKNMDIQNIASKSMTVASPAATTAWSTTTTASTNFIIYNASGSLASEYSSFSTKSPFEAISKIVKASKTNYTVRESTNTSKIVFKYEPTVRTKFYCFQYTNFYGCVGVNEVKDWTRGYLYTHVVRSDGYYGSNTDVINSTGTNQPFAHSYSYQLNDPDGTNEGRLEGNSGAYVYKFSNTTSKTKATMIVNLSEATLHYSSNQITTFYSYINATSQDNGWFTCDIGLAMSLDADGHMQLVANASEACNIVWSDSADQTIVLFDKNGTTFTAQQDVKIYFEVTNGCYHGKIYNYTTNVTKEVWVYNSKIRATNLVFLNATSLVPYTEKNGQIIVSDIRCGAYAENIPILYPRLYTSSQNWDGTGTEFAPNSSSVTNSLIVYDTDHATHSYNASQKREVINIDYTNNYER